MAKWVSSTVRRAEGLLRAFGYKAKWGQSHQGPLNPLSISSLPCIPLWVLGSGRDEYLIVFIKGSTPGSAQLPQQTGRKQARIGEEPRKEVGTEEVEKPHQRKLSNVDLPRLGWTGVETASEIRTRWGQ